MKWKELTINTTEYGIEIVLARLDMLGIQQVNIVQGHDEVDRLLHSAEKYWDYAEETLLDAQPAVQVYFSDMSENGDTEAAIRDSVAQLSAMRDELGFDIGSLDIHVRTVDEEDWANNWKAFFKPINVGERLLVCPSWEKVPSGNERAVLKIDPGMAFGTGSHHTTRMCLEMLERHIKDGDLVADLGCGSGILSIAACLLGAREVNGIDIDPVASRVALENARLNEVDYERFMVMNGDILSDMDFRRDVTNAEYDIVLANIVANVIIAFAPLIPSMLRKGGLLIASGIIDDRLDEVIKKLKDCGLETLEVTCGEDWRAVLARKLAD